LELLLGSAAFHVLVFQILMTLWTGDFIEPFVCELLINPSPDTAFASAYYMTATLRDLCGKFSAVQIPNAYHASPFWSIRTNTQQDGLETIYLTRSKKSSVVQCNRIIQEFVISKVKTPCFTWLQMHLANSVSQLANGKKSLVDEFVPKIDEISRSIFRVNLDEGVDDHGDNVVLLAYKPFSKVTMRQSRTPIPYGEQSLFNVEML